LESRVFTEALAECIRQLDEVLSELYALETTGLGFFGSRGQVMALKLRPDDAFRHGHEQAIAAVYGLLEQAGVPDPAGYAESDPDLHHLSELEPHITLLRDVRGDVIPRPESMPERVSFGASGVFHPPT
jgi:hypothetical protein